MPARPVSRIADGRVELDSPVHAPRAGSFLWNDQMLLHVNCRGFVKAQYMDPEPRTWCYGPVMEAATFMLPEAPYYAHHPGRFVYVKDESSNEIFSIPHEPVRARPDGFVFAVADRNIEWRVKANGLSFRWHVTLPEQGAAEIWTLEVRNDSGRQRTVSLYPYFSIGYVSWMNQSAEYRQDLGAVVATSVTPYQQMSDYDRIRALRDRTAVIAGKEPLAWETSLETFEGDGGLTRPDAVAAASLTSSSAAYEPLVAVLQYREKIAAGAGARFGFVVAPVRDVDEIAGLRRKLPDGAGGGRAQPAADPPLRVSTPDPAFDHFVNHWLHRQVRYLGRTHRWTSDPQTRNYLQDQMGLAFIDPAATRSALLLALSQQAQDGAMPDGILLHPDASLKYINQVPHTDHNVWLPVCMQAYLDETADFGLLDEKLGANRSVFDAMAMAMDWLDRNRDERGLSLIGQGDWCDPMNMAGHGGKGISGWLTIASIHAFDLWGRIAGQAGHADEAARMREIAAHCRAAAQEHLWDGDWFARGISDNGTAFGVAASDEGRIFLNPQSWALMAGLADATQAGKLLQAARSRLATQYGMALLNPPFTRMHEHIGRLTQKHPGSAENGSIYNHAGTFFIFALYVSGLADEAYDLVTRMIPRDDGFAQTQQLPVFVPNYYRGAVDTHTRTAGRSSQLPNTGAAAWLYRIVIEQLFGLRGTPRGLQVSPALPGHWQSARCTRHFRGARFDVCFERSEGGTGQVLLDGRQVDGNLVCDIVAGRDYVISANLPMANKPS